MAKSQEKLKKQVAKMPDEPGVYRFFGAPKQGGGGLGQILYIGKATSLRNRVRSYFASNLTEKRSPLIAKMMSEARGVKFEKTDSVLEALLLESRLIKKFAPPYNTADKDQKSFNYVVITDEKFPRVLVMREREITPLTPLTLRREPKEKFGPFPHGTELKEALKIVRKIFPFRDKCQAYDRQKWSREQQPCFNYQIGLCPGVCVGVISEKDYKKTIRHIKIFFEGNKKKLVKNLEKEMKNLAQKREFEKAAEIKKKIFALRHIQDIALIRNSSFETRDSRFRIEAYDVAHISGTNMVGVMIVLENGVLKKSDYRMFKIKKQKEVSDTKALQEILERRLKHAEWQFPDLIVVDGGVAQLNAAQAVVESAKLKINIAAVTKDERHKAKEIRSARYEIRDMIEKNRKEILLANSEAHRFAIKFHRKLRDSAIRANIVV